VPTSPDHRAAPPPPATDDVAYDAAFYDEIDQWSRDSAAAIVPWIVDVLSPRAVIDVGCGHGAWLAAFKACGVADILGLDGAHVEPSGLEVEPSEFRAVDLRSPPSDVLGRFDLAVSLEVAEHLPASDADGFVSFLTGCAPVVLFSAAIPGQGGVGHVNEQWPAYWFDRFERHDFRAVDAVRPRFWNDERVRFFFAQNTVVYARLDLVDEIAGKLSATASAPGAPLALVHPEMLQLLAEQARTRRGNAPSFRRLVRQLPGATTRAVRERWNKRAQRPG
jgi:SAM-dependent methyltransferase